VTYVFDPAVVHECSMTCLDQPKPQMFDTFAASLADRYPGRLDFDQPWLYSNAGGAMIQMKLYYASISEYIMIWGTPIGSEGHSGRHLVGFWDTVIDGEMWYYGEGQFEKRVYRPGDRVYVGPRQARAMNFTTGVWAVEYARGPIATSLPFGIFDGLFSTLDLPTLGVTFGVYASLVGRAWRQEEPGGTPSPGLRSRIGKLTESIGDRLTALASPPPVDDAIPSGIPGVEGEPGKGPEPTAPWPPSGPPAEVPATGLAADKPPATGR